MRSSNTRATMLYRLIRNGKLPQVVADHFRANFYLIKSLAVVNTDNRTNHFGENDHIAKVRLHHGRFLPNIAILLTFTQLIKKSLMLDSKATSNASPLPR